jgi:hypothetical protein
MRTPSVALNHVSINWQRSVLAKLHEFRIRLL